MKNSGRSGTIMMSFGGLLLAAALGLACYTLVGEYQAEKNADEALVQVEQLMEEELLPDSSLETIKAEEVQTPVEETQEAPAETEPQETAGDGMTVRMIDQVDYIGVIEIPSLSLKLPIINDWDDAKLKIAPCRYVGSAYDGNMIISGHSYKKHFRYIRNLPVGASVIFTDFEGTRFVYEVTSYEVIGGTDVENMLSGDWDLSLFTCTYNGSARHTVRCKLIPEENPWLEEHPVPESIYDPAEGGWRGMETEMTELE